MAVATAGPDAAVISGIGLLAGGSQYLSDGNAFLNSSMPKVSLQQTQDTQRIGDSDGFGVTGSFSFFGVNGTLNAVAISRDSGATFSFSVLTDSDHSVPARYGSFPSADQGYVATGVWPDNVAVGPTGTRISQNIHLRHGAHTQPKLHFDMPSSRKSGSEGWAAGMYVSSLTRIMC
jgi:hypothetical protein